MRELINDIIFELKKQKKIVRTIRKKQSQILKDLNISSGSQLGGAVVSASTSTIRKKRKDG